MQFEVEKMRERGRNARLFIDSRAATRPHAGTARRAGHSIVIIPIFRGLHILLSLSAASNANGETNWAIESEPGSIIVCSVTSYAMQYFYRICLPCHFEVCIQASSS